MTNLLNNYLFGRFYDRIKLYARKPEATAKINKSAMISLILMVFINKYQQLDWLHLSITKQD